MKIVEISEAAFTPQTSTFANIKSDDLQKPVGAIKVLSFNLIVSHRNISLSAKVILRLPMFATIH